MSPSDQPSATQDHRDLNLLKNRMVEPEPRDTTLGDGGFVNDRGLRLWGFHYSVAVNRSEIVSQRCRNASNEVLKDDFANDRDRFEFQIRDRRDL